MSGMAAVEGRNQLLSGGGAQHEEGGGGCDSAREGEGRAGPGAEPLLGLKVTGEGRLCAPLVLLNPGSCPTRK